MFRFSYIQIVLVILTLTNSVSKSFATDKSESDCIAGEMHGAVFSEPLVLTATQWHSYYDMYSRPSTMNWLFSEAKSPNFSVTTDQAWRKAHDAAFRSQVENALNVKIPRDMTATNFLQSGEGIKLLSAYHEQLRMKLKKEKEEPL
jgi:hypothetical protein